MSGEFDYSDGPLQTACHSGHNHMQPEDTGSQQAALECRGLTKRFGQVQAIAGLDLTVLPGQVVALLGPSGCGKTTALRLIAGFEQPDEGSIRVGGRQVILRDIQYGKYAGRVVARIQTPDGDDLADALIAAGLGHPYDGAARAPWCVGAKAG